MQQWNHILIKSVQRKEQLQTNYPVRDMSLVLTAELNSTEGSSNLYPLRVPRTQHG